MENRDELLREFLDETKEALERLDADLIALEADPQNSARLDAIFRTLHTLKGSAGFLQFAQLGTLAHAGENLLAELRSGTKTLTPDIINELLGLVDGLRRLAKNVEVSGSEGDADAEAKTVGFAKAPKTSTPPPRTFSREPTTLEPPPPGKKTPEPRKPAETMKAATPPSRSQADALSENPAQTKANLPKPSRPPIELSPAEPARPRSPDTGSSTLQSESIRVNVQLLDQLMNLVGELVLARNQIAQFSRSQNEAAYSGYAQQLNQITISLQAGIMKTRLQQIGALWQRFPRLVRDLSRQSGKEVSLEIEGSTTELDKSLLEALADPMLHLIRNAIDHGIEKPELRRAKGKPDRGRLHLRAYHEGGQVHIEIEDDGAGLDTAKIRERAIERGLVTEGESLMLSEEQIQGSIFLPGFSTAEAVTDLSGRGVGMDVVKTSIERIGGMVDLNSRPDRGMTVHIKAPLTLAIIPALIVLCGNQRYAIPQASLSELLTITPQAAERAMEKVHESLVYRLRGRLLPLIHLHDVLHGEARPFSGQEKVHLVVLQVDNERFALVVDGVADAEEIVVKPLGCALHGVPVYAGATILGDGAVALILDVLGIARRTGVLREQRRASVADALPAQVRIVAESVLVCEVGSDRRIGIPLSQLVRIERLPRASIETSYEQDVVQCGDELLPLVHLHKHLRHEPLLFQADKVSLVVCRHNSNDVVGLAVDRVLDIVEAPADVREAASEAGLAGTAILLGRVTDILDVPGLLREARPVTYNSSTRSQLLQTRGVRSPIQEHAP